MAGRFTIPVILLALCSTWGWAQVEVYPLEFLSTSDGLSNGTVWSVHQDRTGFMWIGTNSGLNRFDGYQWRVFHHTGEKNALSGNQIRSLYQDKSGLIWIGTEAGLDCYNPSTQQLQEIPLGGDTSVACRVSAISPDPVGGLWLGTNDGLKHLNPEDMSLRAFRHDPVDPYSLIEDYVRTVWVDEDGLVWVGTTNGVSLFRPEKDLFENFYANPKDPTSLSHPSVRAIFRDNHGHMWVGTDSGLNLFEPESQTFNHQVNKALPDTWINTVASDAEGRLWVGTRSGGLVALNDDHQVETIYSSNRNRGGLPTNNIVSLYPSADGLLWAGTYKAGLVKLDLKPQKFRTFSVDFTDRQTNPLVTDIFKDRTGNLWLSNQEGLIQVSAENGKRTHFHHDPNALDSLSSNSVTAMSQNRNGRFWVGTYNAGLNLYQPESQSFQRFRHNPKDPKSLPSDAVNVLAADAQDVLWVGTYLGLHAYLGDGRFKDHHFPDAEEWPKERRVYTLYPGNSEILWVGTNGGFCRILPKQGGFKRFRNERGNPHSLSHNVVISLLEDWQGRVWVGTGNGLNLFDQQSETFRVFNMEDGLSDVSINGLADGSTGEIWISTNSGLVRFEERGVVTVYDHLDGLQSSEFFRGSVFKARDGEIFFGGTNGYNSFFPELLTANPHVPNVVVTKFNVFDKEYPLDTRLDPKGRLQLTKDETYISFEFAALDFTSSRKNQYAYRMVGVDPDWIDAGNRRFASYTNLPGGDFVFQVKASNSDGVWNHKGLSIPVRMVPPIWEQAWFRAGLLMLLITSGVGVSRYRLLAVRAHQARLKELAEKRTENLRLANHQLAEEARKAGIAEVTTSVLHNIGNILNSVVISSSELMRILEGTRTNRLRMVHKMLAENGEDLHQFLTTNEKGKLIPEFLDRIQLMFENENKTIHDELRILGESINLMEAAVAIEQSYVKSIEVKEATDIRGLVDNVLRLLESSLRKRNIDVIREYDDVPDIYLETFKMMHVLTNLVKNAMEALTGPEAQEDRKLRIIIKAPGDGFVEVHIKDNGCGVPKENLSKIFQYGFTTKHGGHGFGLHSVLQTMKELGGTLTVGSRGLGKGATFILKIPQ